MFSLSWLFVCLAILSVLLICFNFLDKSANHAHTQYTLHHNTPMYIIREQKQKVSMISLLLAFSLLDSFHSSFLFRLFVRLVAFYFVGAAVVFLVAPVGVESDHSRIQVFRSKKHVFRRESQFFDRLKLSFSTDIPSLHRESYVFDQKTKTKQQQQQQLGFSVINKVFRSKNFDS